MGNMFGMFLFAFWVFSTQKCESVKFPKSESACVPARLLQYLSVPILLIACVPCACTCNVHAHHDITRFAYDANHVTMMSPVFTFHIGMRWHDVIGVCIG